MESNHYEIKLHFQNLSFSFYMPCLYVLKEVPKHVVKNHTAILSSTHGIVVELFYLQKCASNFLNKLRTSLKSISLNNTFGSFLSFTVFLTILLLTFTEIH